MKILAYYVPSGNHGSSSLTIQGTPVVVPNQIAQVDGLVGPFGIHIIQLAINLLIFAASLLVFFYVIYGGWKWMTSEGDKKKVEDARTTIIYSAIGLVVIILSFLIINVIGAFFKVNLLQIG